MVMRKTDVGSLVRHEQVNLRCKSVVNSLNQPVTKMVQAKVKLS